MATVRVNKRRKTSSHSWLESTNPLWGLSIAEARLIYDAARRGNYARLQYLYDQVERADPVLLTCVERRASALASLGWHVVKARGAEDSPIVEKQLNAVECLLDGIDNLSEAIEHLSLAFFRGYSHCQPEWNAKGYVEHINKLNSWNFSRNVTTGAWHWNENADSVLEVKDLPEIPSDELITVERPRAIDYPALSIYLRHNLAESDWGRFLERYGIPPCTITMPDNISPAEVQAFQEAAVAIAEARSGALPAGSQVSYGTEARGTDPFSAFIQHQEKLIVLLATGGTLTSLAESGSGTLAGHAQMDVWKQIVARDAEIIGDAIHRAIVIPFLGMHFPEEKIAVKFELGHEEEQSASDIFDLAAKAKAAGYIVEKGQLEERTGFILEKDTAMGGFGMLNSTEDTREAVADPLHFSPKSSDDKILTNSEKTLQSAILGFSEDMKGTAKSLQDLLAADDEEFLAKAKAMAEASPEELGFASENLAGAIEVDIAHEVADTLGEKSVKNSEQEEELENDVPTRGCRAKNPSECPTHGTPREHKDKEKKDSFGSTDIEKLGEDPTLNHHRAEKVISKLSKDKTGKFDIAWRKETGWIQLDWGTPGAPGPDETGVTYKHGHGLSHIMKKHKEVIGELPAILSKGKITEHSPSTTFIILDKYKIVLGKTHSKGKFKIITCSYAK